VSSLVAVVTGANRGLGLEVSRQLAERGVHVVMTARDTVQGRVAADLLRARGGGVDFHALDVTDRAGVQALRQFLEHRHGRVDILINNAGAHPANDGSGLAVSNEAMSAAFSINCLGALQVTQGLVAVLAKSPAARIINVSTILALPSWLDQMAGSYFAYRISKAALNAVTAGLAAELKDQHISVNAIHPGWLQTAMGDPDAPDPVEVGASAVLNLALDVPSTVSGRMFAKNELIGW